MIRVDVSFMKALALFHVKKLKECNYLYERDNVILEADKDGQELARNVWGTRFMSLTSISAYSCSRLVGDTVEM